MRRCGHSGGNEWPHAHQNPDNHHRDRVINDAGDPLDSLTDILITGSLRWLRSPCIREVIEVEASLGEAAQESSRFAREPALLDEYRNSGSK